jgi:hypothetical protein
VGADLQPLGPPFDIADRGEALRHAQPAVVYRPVARDFLVTWLGLRPDGSTDVFAQRVGPAGVMFGPDNLNVTADAGGHRPISHSLAASTDNVDAVVSWADDDAVRARRLGRRLSLGPVRRVSGPAADTAGGAGGLTGRSTSVAYQPRANEWLVAWSGTGPESPIGPGGARIAGVFGQHLSTYLLRERGPDDFPISETVTTPIPSAPDVVHRQSAPAVAADPTSRDYLVAWETDFFATEGRSSIFARRATSEPPRP